MLSESEAMTRVDHAMAVARTRIDTRGIDSINLKISKVMPKYGSKTLKVSMGGGNIPMMVMNICIICIQLNGHA